MIFHKLQVFHELKQTTYLLKENLKIPRCQTMLFKGKQYKTDKTWKKIPTIAWCLFGLVYDITLTPLYISFSGGIKITIKGKGFLDVGEVHAHNVVSYRLHQMDVVWRFKI